MNTVEEYDKPFKTYDELLNLLESRNVIITNKDFAKECLSELSYYDLINGYKSLYEIDNNNNFINPVSFYDFYFLHTFDTIINSIIFKYIIMIEKSLKTKIAYIISKNYGVHTDLSDKCRTKNSDYLHYSHYSNCNKRDNILYSIKKTINESNNKSIQHYLYNHNHLPCWILINAIAFGLSIKWYEILKSEDKTYICEEMIHTNLLSLDEKKIF